MPSAFRGYRSICYGAAVSGNVRAMYGFNRYGRLVVAVALVTALGLGGCGRKGALDAPPSAAIGGGPAAPQEAVEPTQGFLMSRPAEPAPPEAPPATTARKTFFLDWLLN